VPHIAVEDRVGDIRQLLQRADASLDAALANVENDSDAALDDLLAARLLITTAVVSWSP